MRYSIRMRAIVVTGQHGWIVAWAVSLVLFAQQGHGTALFFETLLLLSLLSFLVFVMPRTAAALATAVVVIVGIVTLAKVFSRLICGGDRRVHHSNVPIRFLHFQLPPPSFC